MWVDTALLGIVLECTMLAGSVDGSTSVWAVWELVVAAMGWIYRRLLHLVWVYYATLL